MSVLRRNILFLFASQLATWLITVILLVLAPRRLGAEGFGRLQFATAFVGFFNLIGSLGSYQYLVRSIARDRSALGPLVISALRLKLLMGVVLSGMALTLGWALGYSGEVMTLIAIGCAGMNLHLLNEMVVAGLAGMERMARTAVWQTAQVYAASLAGIVILLTTRSLVAFAAAFAIAWTVPLVANAWTLRPFLRDIGTKHAGAWRAIITGGVPVFALTALSLFYSTIDIPIVEAISGEKVVGWYTLAYRWVGMPIFVTTIVVTAFLPQMSALAAQAPEAFGALTNRAIKLVLVVNIPASVGLVFVSSDLVDLLYGPDYEQSVVLMQLLAMVVPLTGLNTVLATSLVASDRHKRYVWVAACAAVFNPLFSVIAIRVANDRYDNGAIGAAIVTVLTEVFITTCALRMRRSGVMNRATIMYCLRCACAAAIMVVPLVILKDGGLFVKVPAGAAAYALGSLAFGTVSWSRVKRAIVEIRAKGLGGQGGSVASGDTREMSEAGGEP